MRVKGLAGRVAFAIVLAVALTTISAPDRATARAARSKEPYRAWVTDGSVFALASTPRGLFAGGDFTLIGPPTGTWVPVSASGTVPAVRRPIDGTVIAAAADGRGGWYLAGNFFYIGDAVRRAVFHLLPSGRLDKHWKPRLKGSVSALVRVRSTLYMGGDFTKFGRKKRLRLAAVNVKTGALLRWAPRVAAAKKDQEAFVSALAPSRDGKTIYVGGSFSRIGQKRRSNLGAVGSVHGSVRPWHPRVSGEVTALALDPRGRRIYAGGHFVKAGGLRRAGLAAFDLHTGAATRWDPDCDGSVSRIVVAPSGSPVYIAGEYASIGEKSRRGVAAVDSKRGAATSWDPNVGGFVNALLLSPRQHAVYIGGEFDGVGDADRSNLAAIDTRTGAPTSWNPQAIGPVDVLARARRGAIEVGGSFSSVGAARRPRLALFGPDGTLSDWAPQIGGTAVHAISVSPDGTRIYVGGRFTLGDRTARSLAIVDAATLAIAPWGPSINSGVWALAPSPDGQTIYLGGSFTSAGGHAHRRLAVLDATGTLVANWTAGASALVSQLVLSGDQLWAAGSFSTIGGATHKGVASLDPANGLATGWDAGADDNVSALAVNNDSVFVGGDFTSIGGRSRKYLAELDAGDGSATRWDPAPDDVVLSLGISPDARKLIVLGDFLKISGARRDIGEFDLTTGFLTPWNPYAPFSATAVAFSPDSSTLYVGGEGVLAVYR